jgi:hypothetical protein
MAAPAAGAAVKKVAKKAAASKGKGDLPQRGDWRQRAQDNSGSGKGKGTLTRSGLKGESGKYRRMLIAEFIVCVMLLGLSPLAKPSGEMGPIRFMKRGSATCAFFIILGLLSSAGKGAARASAMFGALVTLVLLVDQREAFGKLAKTLNTTDADEAEDAATAAAGAGPDDSTAVDDNPGVAQV